MIYGGQAKFLITPNLSTYLQYKSFSVSVKHYAMNPVKKRNLNTYFSCICKDLLRFLSPKTVAYFVSALTLRNSKRTIWLGMLISLTAGVKVISFKPHIGLMYSV